MGRRKHTRQDRHNAISGAGCDLPAQSPQWYTWLPVLIVLAGCAAYANSFNGVFLFDDDHHIVCNDRIRDFGNVVDLLRTRRPFVTLSLALNYQATELRVWSYHAWNVAVHLLAALTLYGVVRRTAHRVTGAAAHRLALAVAILWVVHPLQTQAVTYVIQRGESMMGLFYLLTLYCFLRGVDSTRSRRWFGAAVLACGVGMGCKAVMVTAPVLVLVFDRTFVASSMRELLRRRYGLYSGLAGTWIVVVATGVARGIFSPPSGAKAAAGFAFQGATALDYALTQPGVILHYLRLSVWPSSQCLDYAWPLATTAMDIVPQAVVVASLSVASVWSLRRRPWLGFCGVWFFLILAPTSSIVPLRDNLFEHRMYLPLAAVIVVAVLGMHTLLQKRILSARSVLVLETAAVTALAAVLMLATQRRNAVYHTDVSMWHDVATKRPENPRAFLNLGGAYAVEERYRDAEAAYRKAIAIDYAYPRIHYKLGIALFKQGRLEEAAGQQRIAIELRPEETEPHYHLGMVLMAQGRDAEAETALRDALAREPQHVEARSNLGVVLGKTGRLDAAVTEFRATLQFDPTHTDTLYNLAFALTRLKRYDEAIEAYERLLRLKPDDVQSRRALDRLLSVRSTG